MRTKLALGGVVAALAAAFAPLPAASASCWYVTEDICVQPPCPDLAGLYDKLDARTGGALPDRGFECMT